MQVMTHREQNGKGNGTEILKSVYSRGRGSGVFIEAHPTKPLIEILSTIPGVMKRSGIPVLTYVPPAERKATLTMAKDGELKFAVGQWVWVSRGTYGGDLGYITALHSWGSV